MRHQTFRLRLCALLAALPMTACGGAAAPEPGEGTGSASTGAATATASATATAEPTPSGDGMPPYDQCGARIVELSEFTTIAEQDPAELQALAEEWNEHADTTVDEGLALTARDVADRLQHAVENQDLYYPGTSESLELASLLEDYALACDDVGR
jgi:hypothetical protein